jgi:ADP-heptose:LPS heptosyltransferase
VVGNPPSELPLPLLEDNCANALFGIFIEGLADRFEPALCDIYANLFSRAVEGEESAALVARYQRVRRTRAVTIKPRRVLVPSRVTLGADVAITSVLLDAAKSVFPEAEIIFAGPRKNIELFVADPRLKHAEIEYSRGTIRQRMAVWEPLRELADAPDCLILDPDSRLTQLGLLPIGAEDRYHLFESRRYGSSSESNLTALAAQWCRETMGISNAIPYLAPEPLASLPFSEPGSAAGRPARSGGRSQIPYIAVSLGVGENAAKRISDSFERQLLALLATRFPLVIDRGIGGEEAARVERAVARAGIKVTFWNGSFAGFAQIIARARLYVGYDSAGQHVAAACGVPLISIFAGFPAIRMFYRWSPAGPRATVIRVDMSDPAGILSRVAEAVK